MRMKLPEIKLVPLHPEDREQFILDNQWAFKYGAQQEFGMREGRPGKMNTWKCQEIQLTSSNDAKIA